MARLIGTMDLRYPSGKNLSLQRFWNLAKLPRAEDAIATQLFESKFGAVEDLGLSCQSCGSANQKQFESEVGIHFPKLRDVKRQPVLLYPMIVVCLDCGRAEFAIPREDLNSLRTV